MQIHLKEDGKTVWEQSWHIVGGKQCYFRSKAEYRYAMYLEFLKSSGQILEWKHEPKTFWFEKIKRGVRSYKPDFEIELLSGKLEFHEVKGYMDAKSKTKIKRMGIYYPEVKLRVIDSEWFKKNSKTLKSLINGW